MNTTNVAKLAALAVAAIASTIGPAAVAQADQSGYEFSSPSGNIACGPFTTTTVDGQKAGVFCDIRSYAWQACGGHGQRFVLSQEPGVSPHTVCNENTADPGTPALPYGQTRSFPGPFTCGSEPTGVRCTDTSTGHFFRISQESYDLG
jgi:hypothetical protein